MSCHVRSKAGLVALPSFRQWAAIAATASAGGTIVIYSPPTKMKPADCSTGWLEKVPMFL